MSFEQLVLPTAVERGMGIQGMKNFGNAKLLQSFSAKECLSYVLSLPVHCTAIGCTTIGQLEDDVRIARQFKPLTPSEMVELRKRGKQSRGRYWKTGNGMWKRKLECRHCTMVDS